NCLLSTLIEMYSGNRIRVEFFLYGGTQKFRAPRVDCHSSRFCPYLESTLAVARNETAVTRQPLQIRTQFGGVLVPEVGPFSKALGDDALDYPGLLAQRKL